MRAHLSLILVAGALLRAPSVAAQVPTFEEVTGHAFGERITLHHEMVHYLERLAEASPRVTIERQGESWEGRTFMLAIVTSPENHARVEEIRANSLRLDDPRATPSDEAAAIIANQPVIAWFGGSIHGDELSGSEGVLKLLDHLATRNDAATLDALSNVVVLIDPMLNPDGRDAMAVLSHGNSGRMPSAEPEDWVNDFTAWQRSRLRTGHYFFDNNRDWFAHTQPETKVRVATWRAWRPQTIVDMHEMVTNADNEFFFYPGSPPISRHVPPFAHTWLARFGDKYAAAFDSAGFEYMTREEFDYFYPGYTDIYGSHLGAVGMLYEQGTSRGLALRRSDRSVRTLLDALQHQYAAAWTAVRVAATERETLLREYYDGLAQTIVEGAAGTRRFLIAPGRDPAHRAELANLLMRAGVEIGRLTQAVTLRGVRDRSGRDVGERAFGPGTFVVDLAQPRGRLIRALLDPETPIPEDFLGEARARVDRGQEAELYDLSAWSLPLLFDLEAYGSTDGRNLPVDRLPMPAVKSDNVDLENQGYAYLLDGRNAASVAALYHLLDRGYRAGISLTPTRIKGVNVPSGTIVVRVVANGDGIHDAVREIVSHHELDVQTVASGLGDEGFMSLGSEDVIAVRKPVIGIVAEDPIAPYSFGWAWYTLDRQYEIPSTPLRIRSIAGRSLDRFDVLIVPSASSGALSSALGSEGIDRIRRWVRDGGALVTIGSATGFALDSSGLNLIELRSWYDTEDGEEAQRFDVPGAILRGWLDTEYWLAAGYEGSEFPVLVNGSRVYLPPKGAPSASRRVVGRFVATDSLRLSGHAWPESLERLRGAVFLYEERVGSGRVIAFAEDPSFRGYWRGANRLFLNAVVIGPSAP